jgi:hypothetical protein
MMIAKMNARPLSGIIVVDVEDFGIEWCNAFGRLLADLAHWSGKSRDGTINGKKTPW